MIRASLALTLLAASTAAFADDSRIVERIYDAGKVVRIEGRTKVQATIQFGEDEHIENVAIGDSEAWQVTPNKRANLLFVKPLSPGAATNMTVVTDRHTYLFDLVASARANPLYVLRFTYPNEPKPSPQLATTDGPTEEEFAAITDPRAVTDPAELNFAWEGKGDRKLLPARTYDDGAATFLAWPADSPVPAILVKDAKGMEGPVNFTVRGDVIVVDGVPREIVLRSGKDAATIVNNGPVRAAPALAAPQAALARTDTQIKEGNR
ncbi:TrbG/VirB9 family P-type conjugative transfer protein [Tsuneonella sp. YG55]|uniref:TrbG/VirB9 family P-type conjugative transfer protein n=1 Tax=Tsuneonella litorea TaxID=2976475 RepID=A0A9X2W3F2_9SPHN|nr:TrbG/VirB9 family P-type conjugative transfer protein [Tsuneonella litorea]MCT2559509.1 TrbG/VirB9 family P-type conjugative transfer protein [Tsuneonella litorea]